MKKLFLLLFLCSIGNSQESKTTSSSNNNDKVFGADLIRLIAHRIPGANVLSNNITLRGGNYVMWEIDGMLYEVPPPIAVSQIRYVNALVGLSETNRYGQQGAGGVIVIKTENNVTEQEYKSSRNLWNIPPPLTKEERKALKAERKAKRLAKKNKKNN